MEADESSDESDSELDEKGKNIHIFLEANLPKGKVWPRNSLEFSAYSKPNVVGVVCYRVSTT